MSSYERLIAEHDGLTEAANGLVAVLTVERPQIGRAMRRRDRLRTLLENHLACEDAEIYPRLMSCSDPMTVAVANCFAENFQTLATDWAAYLGRWPGRVGDADWADFCADSTAIADRLALRIAEENNLLYPTALAASVISLRESRQG